MVEEAVVRTWYWHEPGPEAYCMLVVQVSKHEYVWFKTEGGYTVLNQAPIASGWTLVS